MSWTRRIAALGMAGLAAMSPALAPSARGQETNQAIAAIDAEFAQGLKALEETRIAKLDALAKGQQGPEATATLEALFRSALNAHLFEAAEPAAERVLKAPGDSPVVDYLAAAVNVLAEADRGQFEQSYQSILAAQAVGERGGADAVAARQEALPPSARIGLIEAYYQRLAQADQFPILRRALAAIAESAARTGEAEVADYIAARLRQIDMIGQPAPDFAGTDQDGRPVRFAELAKDHVVLIVFWATWCVPSADQTAWLEALHEEYADEGFRLVGVNLDLHQEGASAEVLEPHLRRFLIEHNVHWPSILDGPGDQSVAALYGVTEIPATVLVGADGRIAHLDVSSANAEAEVRQALQAAGKLPAE
jgi:peroxiredoxin